MLLQYGDPGVLPLFTWYLCVYNHQKVGWGIVVCLVLQVEGAATCFATQKMILEKAVSF